jgi:indolepyruvate ferredoxin oxidoreductase
MFQNMGDGTYAHSGAMAVRAAVSANRTSPMNITYKILFNDAAAMTGGQKYEGGLTPASISKQMKAEGVWPIYIVTDKPRDFGAAEGVVVKHRDQLDAVQRELRETKGVSAIIYEQTCAAEKRRRRKRGQFPNPPQRIFINPRVCEGCGDCGVQSNCVALNPVETTFGRKRRVDQSACNKDYSCLKAFCPAMVEVQNGEVRKQPRQPRQADGTRRANEFVYPTDPAKLPVPPVKNGAGILCTGIGGTGVVTIGALIGTAAHLMGKGVQVLDEVGMAQKGGAVVTHVNVRSTPGDLSAARVDKGEADLLLAFDLVTASAPDNFDRLRPGSTVAVCNSSERMVGHFSRRPDLQLGQANLLLSIEDVAASTLVANFDDLATRLIGDSMASNLMALGSASQLGQLPVSAESIEQALRINGVSVQQNLNAFMWGRQAAHDLAAVQAVAHPGEKMLEPTGLEEILAHRVAELNDWAQDGGVMASKYEAAVRRVQSLEQGVLPLELKDGDQPLAEAVAKYYFKLLAYKDEFEVGRLHQLTADMLDETFTVKDGQPIQLRYSLGHELFKYIPSFVFQKHGTRGKVMCPGWIVDPMFKVLAHLRFVRPWKINLLRFTAERTLDFMLIDQYESMLEEFSALTPESYRTACQLAALPERIRGYGFVREAHVEKLESERAELEQLFRNPKQFARPASAVDGMAGLVAAAQAQQRVARQ